MQLLKPVALRGLIVYLLALLSERPPFHGPPLRRSMTEPPLRCRQRASGAGAASAGCRGDRNSNTTGSLHMSTSVMTAAPYARRTPGCSLGTAADSTTIARFLVMLLL